MAGQAGSLVLGLNFTVSGIDWFVPLICHGIPARGVVQSVRVSELLVKSQAGADAFCQGMCFPESLADAQGQEDQSDRMADRLFDSLITRGQ
jgi:hypothetical protein